MLEMFLVREIVFLLTGVMIGIGVITRLVTGISLKRLVKAASNMSKSNHPLMRLVRAKFEHGCMVSDKVQNVDAFVEKYLYEYRVLGVRMHTWRQWTKGSIWLCFLFGMIGTALAYAAGEREQELYRYGILGGTGVIVLLLLRVMADDSYQIEAAKTYMVDFLENTYAHRYAKANQKEIQVTVQRNDETSDRSEEKTERVTPAEEEFPDQRGMPFYEEAAPVNAVPIKGDERNQNTGNRQKQMAEQQLSEAQDRMHKKDRPIPVTAESAMGQENAGFQQENTGERLEPTKEARIREILEEFLA